MRASIYFAARMANVDTDGGKAKTGPTCLERGKKKLQPHQRKLLTALMQSKRRGAIAIHGAGTGKTLLSVTASKCFLDMNPKGHIIVITPASLLKGFRDELREFEAKTPMDKYHFYTYAGFLQAAHAKSLPTCEGALVIIDEVQTLKDSDGAIFAAVHACTSAATRVLGLSATPIINGDADIMALMAIVSGEPVVDSRLADAILASDKLTRAFFGCQLSFFTNDPARLAAFYPKVSAKLVPIIMDAAACKTYCSLENNTPNRAVRDIFGLAGDSADTDLQSFFNGLRRVSSSSAQKIAFMMTWIKALADKKPNSAIGLTKAVMNAHTDKSIIFTHFREHGLALIVAALRKLGVPFAVIDGKVDKTTRGRIVADYVVGKIKVILISAAGATGLNLLETGYVFLMEPSWNESEVIQVTARAVRYLSHDKLPSGKRNVLVMKLMLIKKSESREFDRIAGDRIQYEERAEPPSIDIKMYVDSHRKQKAIEARLAYLEAHVPSIEDCAARRLDIASFAELRTYRRTSARIATTPSGVRSSGSYYAPGPKRDVITTKISFNDNLIREAATGSGVSRFSAPTAVLFAGPSALLDSAFVRANSKVHPHIYTGEAINKRYRLGVINWAMNFETGASVIISEAKVSSTLHAMNAMCDTLLILSPETKRQKIKDELVGRTFAEASYESEFDRLANVQGVCIIVC